jgi:site-specific DNA recombinase
MKTQACGYVRVSTTLQKAENTPEIQQEQIRKYCSLHDYELTKIYEDVESGKKDSRPGLLSLFEDARAGKFQKVIFTKLDRFGRSLRFILECYDKLEEMNIGVISISENIDTSTPTGKLLRNILGTLAEFEATRITERMAEGRYIKTLNRTSLPGRRPYGYKFENGKVLIDEEEIPILREIFKYYLVNRLAIRHLVQRLNQEGHRTPRGKYWQDSSVTRILKNPIYCGEAVYFKNHKAPVRIQTPQIITPAQHQKILSLMDEHNTRRDLFPRHLKKEDPFLLRGLLQCKCGSKILSQQDQRYRKPRRYICHWSRRKHEQHKKCDLPFLDAPKLEKLVLNKIKMLMLRPDKIIRQLKSEEESHAQIEKDIQKLQGKIKSGNEKIQRLYTLFEEKGIDQGELLKRIEERKTEISQWEEQKSNQESQLSLIQTKQENINQFKHLMEEGTKRVNRVLMKLDNNQMREFLRTVIDGRLTIVDPKLEKLDDVQGTFNWYEGYQWLGIFRNTKQREYG